MVSGHPGRLPTALDLCCVDRGLPCGDTGGFGRRIWVRPGQRIGLGCGLRRRCGADLGFSCGTGLLRDPAVLGGRLRGSDIRGGLWCVRCALIGSGLCSTWAFGNRCGLRLRGGRLEGAMRRLRNGRCAGLALLGLWCDAVRLRSPR